MIKALKFLDANRRAFFHLFFWGSVAALFWPMAGGEGLVLGDKIVHILLFFVLSFFVYLFFTPRFLDASLVFLFSYAFASELIQQALIIGRSFSWFDLLADAIGVVFGLLFFEVYWEFKKEEEKLFSKKKIVKTVKKLGRRVKRRIKKAVAR